MRDVSKVLSDAEFVKLRGLLSQQPGGLDPFAPTEFRDYPKVLYHPDWLTCWRIIKTSPDELLKKEAKEKMKQVQVIVHDAEQEEDYLMDGWRSDPNDLITEFNIKHGVANPDPRVPTGREGRRARAQAQLTKDEEIRHLRLRYAELMGTPIESDTPDARPVERAEAAVPAILADPADAPRPRRDPPAPAKRRTVGGVPPSKAVNPRDRVKAAAQKSVAARA